MDEYGFWWFWESNILEKREMENEEEKHKHRRLLLPIDSLRGE